MTESEWASCTDPNTMLKFVYTIKRINPRKQQLLDAACSRRAWHLLPDRQGQSAVELAERRADGEELTSVREIAEREWRLRGNVTARDVIWLKKRAQFEHRDEERRWQSALLRCLFGNPFSPPPLLSPSLLAWQDGLILRMAETVYQERVLPAGTLDDARLAVLADALEDAGCTITHLLEHIRSPGPHVRGCWAIDQLTGRK
jgi:hypothetical protein